MTKDAELTALCPIKTPESSHLSLQGDVIVQPLEGTQQGLVGVWNVTWAEKQRQNRTCAADAEKARSKRLNSTTGKTRDKLVLP